MKTKKKYDTRLFYAILVLVALGLIMVASASQIVAQERFRSPFFFLHRHAVRVALGVFVLLIFMRIPYGIYRKLSLWILMAAFVLLVAVFVWGREMRGANRWLHLFNFALQPVEAAKLALVVFLASRLAGAGGRVFDLKKGFIPLASVALGMALVVALQPNFSNAALIMILASILLFLGGCRLRHLAMFGSCMAFISVPLIMTVNVINDRIGAFLNRGQDLLGMNWQIEQSLIAYGSGFILGCGPGRGHQKYSFLPDAHTDFIGSIIGEEFGMVGTVFVLLMFLFILRRAIRAAERAPSSFGYLLALGLGAMIFTTAVTNIAMTLGVVPTTGLPLPFISYGGSSLLASLAAVGIILNISSGGREGRKTSPVQTKRGVARGAYARRSRPR